MRWRALFPFVLCWVAMALAVTIAGVCSSLDSAHADLPLDLFRRGDLHELLARRWFWGELARTTTLPFLVPIHHVMALVSWRVALPLGLFAIALGAIWRRSGRADFARAGLSCLAFAVVPWWLGRLLLGHVHHDDEVGPQIVVMIAGLFWCGLGGLVLSGCQLFGGGRRPAQRFVSGATGAV